MAGVIGTAGGDGDGQCVWRWQVDEGYGSAHRKLVLVSAEMKSLSGAGVLVPTPPSLSAYYSSHFQSCPPAPPTVNHPLQSRLPSPLYSCVFWFSSPTAHPTVRFAAVVRANSKKRTCMCPRRDALRETFGTRLGRHCTVRTHTHITQSCSFLPSSSHSSSHPACICLSTRLDSTRRWCPSRSPFAFPVPCPAPACFAIRTLDLPGAPSALLCLLVNYPQGRNKATSSPRTSTAATASPNPPASILPQPPLLRRPVSSSQLHLAARAPLGFFHPAFDLVAIAASHFR